MDKFFHPGVNPPSKHVISSLSACLNSPYQLFSSCGPLWELVVSVQQYKDDGMHSYYHIKHCPDYHGNFISKHSKELLDHVQHPNVPLDFDWFLFLFQPGFWCNIKADKSAVEQVVAAVLSVHHA